MLLKEDEFEIRKYRDFFIIEYDNTEDSEIKNGFGSLFKYISSDNKENQKNSMTIPVISQKVGKPRKMAFVVPAKFGNQIREPNNPNIHVRKFIEEIFGTIRYSGKSNEAKQARIKKLR